MENSLLMRTEASITLNFLIFIQNVYLNQNRSEDVFKFPYYRAQIAFKEEFEEEYRDLWRNISQGISENHYNDQKIFFDEKELFYQRLFVNHSDSLKEYDMVYESFKVWWGSFAGHFAVERSVDEKTEQLYAELAQSLTEKGVVPKKELSISLIYDESLLVNLEVSSYFAVFPIIDFFVKYHELVPKLQNCFS